jgi:acetyltransferase-like isoleucine patch superfamily enzyme
MQFDIIHDKGLLCCFIGNKGYTNGELHKHFNLNGVDAELVSVEYALSQSTEWLEQRQFFCGLSDVKLKQHVVAELKSHNWFSIVDKSSTLPFYSVESIGYNSLMLGVNTVLDSNTVIGNHCLLFGVFLSHAVTLGDHSVVAPFTYISFYTIGVGVCIGTGVSIIGRPNANNRIVEYSNITAHSRVSKDLIETGTYHNNRLLNSEGSLDRHIL